MCCWHKGENNGAFTCRCKDCLLYAKLFNAVICCFEFTLWVGFTTVAPRLRGPERPVHQPRDQVFWSTALIDIELNSFLLTNMRVHEVYYNASRDTSCSSG